MSACNDDAVAIPADTIRNMLDFKRKGAQLSTLEYPNKLKLFFSSMEKHFALTSDWQLEVAVFPRVMTREPWPRDTRRRLALAVSSPHSQGVSGHVTLRRYDTPRPALMP